MRELAEIREIVVRRLSALAPLAEVPTADGAFYCFLKVNANVDPMILAERLIREHRVAVDSRTGVRHDGRAVTSASLTEPCRRRQSPRASAGSSTASVRFARRDARYCGPPAWPACWLCAQPTTSKRIRRALNAFRSVK